MEERFLLSGLEGIAAVALATVALTLAGAVIAFVVSLVF